MGCGMSSSSGGKVKINVIEATSIALEQSVQEYEEPNGRRGSLLEKPQQGKTSKSKS